MAVEAVPQLVALLNGKHVVLRHEVLLALGRIGQDPERVVPAVIGQLTDPSPLLRQSAIDCLSQCKSDAKTAIGPLKNMLKDREQIIRLAAARAVMSIVPDDMA